MATLRELGDAFLGQAREDLKAARALSDAKTTSVLCMLLQMTFEKLGKAAILRRGGGNPRNHYTASLLLHHLLRVPARTRDCLGVFNARHKQEYVFNLVRTLEMAHPAVVADNVRAGLPQTDQLEFPWEDPVTAQARYPARDLRIAQQMKHDTSGLYLLKFAAAIEENFDDLFP